MAVLKNHYINIAIIIAGIINAIVGGILINSSIQGHSSFGVIAGALIPLAALAFYGDGYRSYKNLEVTETILKKIFKPSIKIGLMLFVLMMLMLGWISASQNEIAFDMEYLYFFAIILAIFLTPNLLVQFLFYMFLKRKIR
ncbi:hypothetical protein HNV08_06095 [Winogradskyella eckloniae]|uniref:hypothetical protein n=1 Tax=Winogradskyella eckloniae TaxID=1089306 RepID=UPI0015660E60|nr:hypothetical protein [Winogradskyella eckloniae]NRD19611.1 hypothetical protein [Winogradskyella eckloniae]